METIHSPGGLNGYLETLRQGTYVPLETILSILKQLAIILAYFKREYGFFHRDLHTDNVLFHKVPDDYVHPPDSAIPLLPGRRLIKLIDFGKSCMTSQITKKQFSVKYVSCVSYDLLTYLTRLLNLHKGFFTEYTILSLKGFFTLPSGENLYDEFIRYKKPNQHFLTHYLTYYQYFEDSAICGNFWTIGGGIRLMKFQPVLDKFLPEAFLEMVDSLLLRFTTPLTIASSGGKSGKRNSKKSRKSRNSRKSRKSRNSRNSRKSRNSRNSRKN
jgi:hypothetical protein